jgi:hypothetical protein
MKIITNATTAFSLFRPESINVCLARLRLLFFAYREYRSSSIWREGASILCRSISRTYGIGEYNKLYYFVLAQPSVNSLWNEGEMDHAGACGAANN